MKRFWKFGAMVAVVLMNCFLSFAKDSAPTAPQGKMADNNNDFACVAHQCELCAGHA